jgi:hypothetical protein
VYCKVRIMAIALVAASVSSCAFGQGRFAEIRGRVAHEPNPVSKAKLMQQLGDAAFAEIETDVMQDKVADALAILRAYRDDLVACDKALDATGVDPEKHSGGFKQLQFSLRDSLRRLDGVIAAMTSDEQPPFVDVRKELSELNTHLMEQLFPHAPGSKTDRDAAKPPL